MRDYADFLKKFADYAAERYISWAVVGSYALVAHANQRRVEPWRQPQDLDLIAILPKQYDLEFRKFLDRKSNWHYEKEPQGLGAIHFWCDDGKQVDIFVKEVGWPELTRSIIDNVLDSPRPIVCQKDLLSHLKIWADWARNDPAHPKHETWEKYQKEAELFRTRIIGENSACG